VKFGFIAKHRGIWAVEWMCGALGVSRGGFYAWLRRPPSKRSRTDEALSTKVRASFIGSDRTYGARRVWHDLLAEGVSCGLHRIERLMRQHGLKARPRRARSRLRCPRTQPPMDCRLSVLATGRLFDERGHDSAARNRCAGDGDLAAGQTRCSDAPLGSRQPIH
jgi:transposase InsO family protein